MRTAIVIPARMASTRFPGKPLVDLVGKPMIQWVVERARAAEITDRILVATPDDDILSVCEKLGVEAVRTRLDHPSGTDRLAEVAQNLEVDVFINVQGDEPLIRPETIRACAQPFSADPAVRVSSVWSPLPEEEAENPAVVKVVTAANGDALYFSRYPIPLSRSGAPVARKKHVGIYGYRRDVLLEFPSWTMGLLEAAESLEQLRFLENGVAIRMSQGEGSELAVDTPEQAEEVRSLLEAKNVIL